MKINPTGRDTFRKNLAALSFCILMFLCLPLLAGESGHYMPGTYLIRDTVMPSKGMFMENVLLYYGSTKLKDGDGNTIKSVTIGNQTLDVDIDLDVWAFSPAFYWIPWDFLGGVFGFVIAPTLQTLDAQAAVSVAGRGIAVEESNLGLGDLMIQPVIGGWNYTHFAAMVGYFFYAPTGRYGKGDPDNLGLGFWSHDIQAGLAIYPWANQATSINAMVTYELNGNKEDEDLSPGNVFTIDYGISQYLSERLEVGLTGYSLWQVTDDTGVDARNPTVHEQAHGIGGQISYWPMALKLNVAARFLWEYNVEDRFKGRYLSTVVSYVF